MPVLDAGADPETLAQDMIEVHGLAAADVARDNARTAALAGQAIEARRWLTLVGSIQRRQSVGSAAPDGRA